MRTKSDPPEPPEGASPVVASYFAWAHLKQLFRQGWLGRGVPAHRCESVAEHSFGVALLAMLLGDGLEPSLDPLKVLRMAILHDLGEAGAGDWTPADGLDREEKHARERASLEGTLGPQANGREFLEIWDEYERGESAEARFVQQIDRLEMVLQASVYESQGLADLSEFFDAVGPTLTEPGLRAILDELTRDRPAFRDDPARS